MNILIAYWLGTGNTEAMVNAVAQGAEKAEKHTDVVRVADQLGVSVYDYITFGRPAMSVEVLEESEFESFFMQTGGTLMNKKVALFGSYGWGSGEWIQSWEECVEVAGINLFENGSIISYIPDADGLDAYESLGERLVSAQKRVQIIRSAFRRLRGPLTRSLLYSYLQAYSLTVES